MAAVSSYQYRISMIHIWCVCLCVCMCIHLFITFVKERATFPPSTMPVSFTVMEMTIKS